MKRIIIFVEGQTEEEFIKELLVPYFADKGINSVVPIKIATSSVSKGGFVNYEHLKNDILKRIRENDVIVSMFVDFFRIPNNTPGYPACAKIPEVDDKIICLEEQIKQDLGFPNFIPYIQKHEFEALLFSSNLGFESLYEEKVYNKTKEIINNYPDPEDINSGSETSPSKRLIKIMGHYEKVFEGNMLALEIGLESMLNKCPRFKQWVNQLIIEGLK